LGLNRAAFFYRPVEVSAYELELMALIDRQYLRPPFYGARRMAAWLRTLDLTRFGRRCWGETKQACSTAKKASTISAGVSTASHRVGAVRALD
jgi:hypothetical protein